MNSITITGRLTRDPELGTTANDLAWCNLRIAFDQPGTSQTGYLDAVAWGELALVAGRDLKKGDEVEIEGRVRYREWRTTIDGEFQTRSRISITAHNCLLTKAIRDAAAAA